MWFYLEMGPLGEATQRSWEWSSQDWDCCCSSLGRVQLFITPWTAACQASLSFTISPSLFKLMSTESTMPSNHLIQCHPLLLSSVFPESGSLPVSQPVTSGGQSIRASASASLNEYSGLISFRMDWFDLLAVQGTFKSLLNTTIQRHQFFNAQPFLWFNLGTKKQRHCFADKGLYSQSYGFFSSRGQIWELDYNEWE